MRYQISSKTKDPLGHWHIEDTEKPRKDRVIGIIWTTASRSQWKLNYIDDAGNIHIASGRAQDYMAAFADAVMELRSKY